MRRIDAGQKQELDAWFAGGKQPAKVLVALVAPEIWRRITNMPEGERKGPTAVLRAAVQECVVTAPVAGARWMKMTEVSSCGFAFEHQTRAEQKAKEKAATEWLRAAGELGKDPERRPTPEEIAFVEEMTMSRCGRGYVPPLCERFLVFWTAGD